MACRTEVFGCFIEHQPSQSQALTSFDLWWLNVLNHVSSHQKILILLRSLSSKVFDWFGKVPFSLFQHGVTRSSPFRHYGRLIT